MDQVQVLKAAAEGPHSIFHQFVLTLSRADAATHFLFFEGDDDPVFYVGYILPYLSDRSYHEFVCNGRDSVLTVQSLVENDGRAVARSLFFVDKDHTDITAVPVELPTNVFQTCWYSFENYLACDRVFRRHWVERLHLSSTDIRFEPSLQRFKRLHQCFNRRMKVLTSVILYGRGIDGGQRLKLNLNNVQFEKLLKLDPALARTKWVGGALKTFLAASNMLESGVGAITGNDLRRIFRKHLQYREAKTYVRGKYELWFLVKVLGMLTRELSDKAAAKATGLPRATPKEILSTGNAVMFLSSLTPCPPELMTFLRRRISIPSSGFIQHG